MNCFDCNLVIRRWEDSIFKIWLDNVVEPGLECVNDSLPWRLSLGRRMVLWEGCSTWYAFARN
jgi:hypothetical protein